MEYLAKAWSIWLERPQDLSHKKGWVTKDWKEIICLKYIIMLHLPLFKRIFIGHSWRLV
jgi:hypothetical protein